jgi:uncharacterized membrane protein
MHGFESSILIERPVETVFPVLSDLENDPKWRREWSNGEKTSKGPVTVGSTYRLVGRALGRRMEVNYEVTAYEPQRTTAWKALSGPLPLIFRRGFERDGGGTRVDFRYEVEEPSLLLRLFGPLVTRLGRRQLEGDFPRLMELLARS